MRFRRARELTMWTLECDRGGIDIGRGMWKPGWWGISIDSSWAHNARVRLPLIDIGAWYVPRTTDRALKRRLGLP